MNHYLWLIPFFPLAGFLLNGLIGTRFPRKLVAGIGVASVAAAFFTALYFTLHLSGLPEDKPYFLNYIYTWIETRHFAATVALKFDALSAVMVLIITGVGSLIHIYSIGYMHGDPGYSRYFAYLNLFTFAMLILVLADNFLLLFLGWEGVGLCSYLLIGFWYEKTEYANAGMKAFIVNRIGDFGFLIAMFLVVMAFSTLNFDRVLFLASEHADELQFWVVNAICLLLLLGATGKSAQIPLYVWLPDAMAGPTPVSALIHAATMVTAGVYLIARLSALFLLAPMAMHVVAWVGALTALYAATIALTSKDIKKVLAYSTISQLGYMFLAVGVGAFAAGIFHLMTHAFFKALLFLGAGSVMHALSGETNMDKMGGLRAKIPHTYKTFVIGSLAIAGIPPLSGFFSKDNILWEAYALPHGSPVLFTIGLLAAGLTAFYMFRMVFLTFHGKSRVEAEVALKLHESPPVMTIPLWILAGLAIVGGFVGIPHVFMGLQSFLEPVFSRFAPEGGHELTVNPQMEWVLMALSVLIALLGIWLASVFYLKKDDLPRRAGAKLRPLYSLLVNKYYVDELYRFVFVAPLLWLSEKVFFRIVDVTVIDGIVNGTARLVNAFAGGLRRMTTGVVQAYALSIFLGLVLMFGYFLLG